MRFSTIISDSNCLLIRHGVFTSAKEINPDTDNPNSEAKVSPVVLPIIFTCTFQNSNFNDGRSIYHSSRKLFLGQGGGIFIYNFL